MWSSVKLSNCLCTGRLSTILQHLQPSSSSILVFFWRFVFRRLLLPLNPRTSSCYLALSLCSLICPLDGLTCLITLCFAEPDIVVAFLNQMNGNQGTCGLHSVHAVRCVVLHAFFKLRAGVPVGSAAN